ncbi:FAD-binding domain-containing protein [Poronia punctata]|nr:FAD-binding domain-containing protein [Poronia punctata]
MFFNPIIIGMIIIPLALANTNDIFNELGPKLSAGATISTGNSSAPRWSEYAAPRPGYTVNVAEEEDVAKTVKYCNSKGIDFLAQSGAHSSPTTFHLDGENDIVINLRGLDFVEVSEDKSEMLVGGGALNSDIIEAAYENGRVVLNGGCNCVGASGLTLGGGLSYFMTEYGMPIDSLISLNLVTSTGESITVSSTSHPDLFWALGGAGPNFGIITSFKILTHPSPSADQTAWTAQLLFPGSKIEEYIEALNNLNMTEKMVNNWQFIYTDPPSLSPSSSSSSSLSKETPQQKQQQQQPFILAGLLYHDPTSPVHALTAFSPLFSLSPLSQTIQILPHNMLNSAVDPFCLKGGRKPSWHVGLGKNLDPSTWRQVWDSWTGFVQKTNLTGTRVLVETYSNYVARKSGSLATAAYPHREVDFHAVFQSVYDDEVWDGQVEELGGRVRELWRGTDGFEVPRTYVNFAHGDERPEEIYGESLPRLRELKRIWDPQNRFNQWLPLF